MMKDEYTKMVSATRQKCQNGKISIRSHWDWRPFERDHAGTAARGQRTWQVQAERREGWMTYPRHPGIGDDPRLRAWSERLALEPEHIPMADFPRFKYSMHDVKRAGEALKKEIIWSEDRRDEILEIFRIANNWIDSHGYPMLRIKAEAIGKVRACKIRGMNIARLKRMRSVRRKLAAISAKLDQIQDLGGCRVIVPSIDEANLLINRFRGSPKHTLHKEAPYIEMPKPGGYRCHHMIYKFQGDGASEVLNGRRVEIQIRTQLQHAWATAVEAVGNFRGEELKAGKGDTDWLRLFELMSAEFALVERCPQPAGLPEHYDRVREIRDLNAKLSAAPMMESMRQAVKYTDSYVQASDPPKFYRIEFNRKTKQARVSPHRTPIHGLTEQHSIEQAAEESGNKDINTVLVSADSIEELKEGFPNYFGDVQLFTKSLRAIVGGGDVSEYNLPPQEAVPTPQRVVGDPAWLRPGRRRRWE